MSAVLTSAIGVVRGSAVGRTAMYTIAEAKTAPEAKAATILPFIRKSPHKFNVCDSIYVSGAQPVK